MIRCTPRRGSARQTRTGRIGLPFLGSALIAAAICGMPAPAALASDGGLTVSTDGVTYSPSNSLPVFPETVRVVPGSSQNESLWVRNEAPLAGRLHVDLLDPRTDDPDLAEHLTLGVLGGSEMQVASSTIASAIARGSCTVLATDLVLQPGETAELKFTASLSHYLDGRDGVLGSVSFNLRGVLEDASVPSTAALGGTCSTGGATQHPTPAKELSATGGPSMTGLGTLGGAALVAGAGTAVISARAHRNRATAAAADETVS